MRLKRSVSYLAAVLALACVGVAVEGQQRQTDVDFRLVVLGDFDEATLKAFTKRVQDYVALRTRLEKGLPPLVVTDNADEIESFERRLAERLRRERSSRRYQVFVPAMERQIKRLLSAKADPGTVAAIMEDGPGSFDVDVNDTYSKKLSLATMPPNILLSLPDLGPDMEYRFVGRHLVLRDVRANMIIDEIPNAIHCHDCVIEPSDDHDDNANEDRKKP